ncbi:hypothetical protein P7K49_035060 [Saguinus oedipus]|uniref:Uncharacterized protein n=1 Tax=Saguinus oedipus TaxID=9490 RepID=A0ABQ9TXL1_SAGOE|nr:hypothetical protein P7K49_035060 [Saguinus oedipus]
MQWPDNSAPHHAITGGSSYSPHHAITGGSSYSEHLTAGESKAQERPMRVQPPTGTQESSECQTPSPCCSRSTLEPTPMGTAGSPDIAHKRRDRSSSAVPSLDSQRKYQMALLPCWQQSTQDQPEPRAVPTCRPVHCDQHCPLEDAAVVAAGSPGSPGSGGADTAP